MRKFIANIDQKVVSDFGSEWSRFDQSAMRHKDRDSMFEEYFQIFPWDKIDLNSIGADIGCGSGRWAKSVAPRVNHLHLVDPSIQALEVAKNNLQSMHNVSFHGCSVDELPFEASSLDFAYSLGVLHHVPDTLMAIRSIAKVLKPGAPCLIYLYYAFDNRPLWFRSLWKVSDIFRRFISRMPTKLKNAICDLIALTVYFPIARLYWCLTYCGIKPKTWPLSYYMDRSFYVMRTDALDRFGTRLEHRFTRNQIRTMLETSGFEKVNFSDSQPYWCAVAYRKEFLQPKDSRK